ncbi:MAG: hypothetical protein F6J98_02010 [Moorea sp. SIO4G2]|nr:hypothetical protein [Moorena sp. SIO4G2]
METRTIVLTAVGAIAGGFLSISANSPKCPTVPVLKTICNAAMVPVITGEGMAKGAGIGYVASLAAGLVARKEEERDDTFNWKYGSLACCCIIAAKALIVDPVPLTVTKTGEIKKQAVSTKVQKKQKSTKVIHSTYTKHLVGDDLARAIIKEAQRRGINNRSQIAYILATAEHESLMGRIMVEKGSKNYFKKYDQGSLKKVLGNKKRGDGYRYRGRGYIQITGRLNYSKWARKLNAPLVSKPHLAAQPKYALPILIEGMKQGSFVPGHDLNRHINSNKTDFNGARRIVNGRDKARKIAGHARNWLHRLDSLGYKQP